MSSTYEKIKCQKVKCRFSGITTRANIWNIHEHTGTNKQFSDETHLSCKIEVREIMLENYNHYATISNSTRTGEENYCIKNLDKRLRSKIQKLWICFSGNIWITKQCRI